MRILSALIIPLLFLACSNSNKHRMNSVSDYHIIPQPVSLEMQQGGFEVTSHTKVSAPSNLQQEGQYLADLLSHASGADIAFELNSSGAITLKIDNTIENKEGYEISVGNNKIVISGKTAAGVFYGIQTLRQLMPVTATSENGKVSQLTIPAVKIKDYPRFVYRGMHLDVGRHMFPVAFIKKYIDLIALHKMNTLHWHLTEDQGWRIEIKKYPKLTEVGSKRYGTLKGHFQEKNGNDNQEYGGFYTQEEVKDIVKYAAERHVRVIPEIELPGHASAAIAAYPFFKLFPRRTFCSNQQHGIKSWERSTSQRHTQNSSGNLGCF